MNKYGKLNQNSANEFPTFQQNFNNDNNKILTKNSTFECALTGEDYSHSNFWEQLTYCPF